MSSSSAQYIHVTQMPGRVRVRILDRPPIYFVRGHNDLTQEEFDEHYKQRLEDAMDEGALFVIGGALGFDRMAFDYVWAGLEEEPRKARTKVFVHESDPQLAYFKGKGVEYLETGFKDYEQRDAAMVKASDDVIAWTRSEKGASGSGKT